MLGLGETDDEVLQAMKGIKLKRYFTYYCYKKHCVGFNKFISSYNIYI